MKTLSIIGSNHFDKWTKHRVACRGIVVCGENILLCYEQLNRQYAVPGGGVEEGETNEECCAREIAEETGVTVTVEEQFLTIQEFYEEYFFETHYFVCRTAGETEKRLTDRERNVGMVPQWVDIKQAVKVFSKHQDYAECDEERRGIYLREYKALNEYVNRTM